MLLILISLVHSIYVDDQYLPETKINIHSGEKLLAGFAPFAIDAQLISYSEDGYCHIRPRHVQTSTQQFQIIQTKDFTDVDIEGDTPLNFRQFTGLAHIRDGLIAITSDLVIYMLKFNYNKITNSKDFLTYGNGQEFASIVWKADLQRIAPSVQSKNEIPQIVFSELTNTAIIVFSDNAQIFSVTQMEQNSKVMDVYQITGWIMRKERGLTKEIDGFVFSSVGTQGIDVYQIVEIDLRYKETLKYQTFDLPEGNMNIIDFTIVKMMANKYYLYLLDTERGAIVVSFTIDSSSFLHFTVVYDKLDVRSGGIALDTKNGANLFVTYQQFNNYHIVEYYLDIEKKDWWIINEIQQINKIYDVDATDEFAIVQGLNSHRIVFSNSYKNMVNFEQRNMISFPGLRDFEFFQATYEKDKLQKTDQSEFQYDDFFFGITSQNAFITRFRVVGPSVSCYSDNSIFYQIFVFFNLVNNTGKFNKYQFIYNISRTVNGQVDKNYVQRTHQNITVEMVKTFLFEDQLMTVEMIGLILLMIVISSLSVICYWWKQFQREQQALSQEMSKYKKPQSIDMTGNIPNQIQFDQSIDQKQ